MLREGERGCLQMSLKTSSLFNCFHICHQFFFYVKISEWGGIKVIIITLYLIINIFSLWLKWEEATCWEVQLLLLSPNSSKVTHLILSVILGGVWLVLAGSPSLVAPRTQNPLCVWANGHSTTFGNGSRGLPLWMCGINAFIKYSVALWVALQRWFVKKKI